MSTDQLLAEHTFLSSWWFLARAYHSLAARLSRYFEEHGITGAQFGVMRCVSDAGEAGLRLSDLSRRLMVTCGNITGVVDRLEQAGYLRRERSWEDRRVIVARLTPDGTALYTRVMPGYLELVRQLMSGLPEPEQQVVSACCRKLHETLEADR